MTVIPGERLGPYQIVALLGVGGMGEVYRATDTNLKRQVAIKVLPQTLAADSERLARFQREAEVLAALNHPNIAHIFGLEKAGGTLALVMELVEGPTLADRISFGPIPLDETLPIAKQIAEALEAAHGQGIIHRDLKPANIKVRPDGAVKVLDFGLAKAIEPAAAVSPSLTESPTITTPAMTHVGTILGTAAYMSPEQVKGRPADRRADLWAFGCVLYEMLTGKRPFDGDDVADTLANVLKSQPDWTTLPPEVPSTIRTLVQRCLAKDVARRVENASTLTYVIDEARALASGGDPIATATPVVGRESLRQRWLLLTLAALVVILIGAVASSLRPSLLAPAVTRFALSPSEGQLTILSRYNIAVSPDGTRLVYYVNGRPFIRNLSEFDSKPVALAPLGQTAFSPDGRALAAWATDDGTIKRVSPGGGPPVTVCRANNVFGMTWHASGIISGQGVKGILRCPVDGGAPEQLAKVADGEEADGPQLLPGEDALLFSIAKMADGPTRWDSARIVVQSLRSGERKTILEGGSAGRYVPSGHLVFARGGVIFAIPFDTTRMAVRGQPVAVVEGVRRTAGGNTGGAQFAVSNTGHLFYIPGPAHTGSTERAIALADRAGGVTRLRIPPGPYVHTRVSRDGGRVAVGTDDGKNAAVWIYQLGGTAALQRLTLEGRNRFPIWSPDGARVAFQSNRDGDQGIFAQRVDGTGPAERLTTAGNGESHVPNSWSKDGRNILVSVAKGSDSSLSILSVADGRLSPFGVAMALPMINAVFSPNGQWIAYSTGRLGGVVASDNGVFVQPFPATGARYSAPKVSIDFHPVWTADGTELIYVTSAASSQFAAVKVSVQAGLTFGAPAILPARITANRLNSQMRAYDILPDGRFIGVIDAAEPDEPRVASVPEIRAVLNWFEELKQRVPTK